MPTRPTKNHRRHHATPLDRLSDWITNATGSWTFIVLHGVWFAMWFGFDQSVEHLTLILSVEAILLASFILMTQRRQEERDNRREQRDLETDLHSEKEIHEVKKMLGRIERRLNGRR